MKGDYAYVAHGRGGHGVSIIDIKNPEEAVLVDKYIIPEGNKTTAPDCWEVQISGNYLFFANGYDGLFVFDISKPDKLELVTSYTDVQYAHNLAITKDIVLLADYKGGCQILSAKGIAGKQHFEKGKQPEIGKREEKPPIRTENVFQYIAKGQVRGVYLDKKYIYLACGDEGLKILDIKNPEKIVGELDDIGIVYDVAVKGDAAYLSSGGQGLKVVDLRDKNNLKVVKTIGAGKFFSDLYLAGDKLIARSNIWAKTTYIDVSDPFNPIMSKKDTPIAHFLGQVSDTAYKDRYLAAVNFRSLYILDAVKNNGLPEMSPREVIKSKGYVGVALKDKYVYVTDGRFGKLTVYKLDDPKNPEKVFEKKYPEIKYLGKAYIEGSKAYILIDNGMGVATFDLENPEEPKLIKKISMPELSGELIYGRIIYKDDKLYVCTGHSGLFIFKKGPL